MFQKVKQEGKMMSLMVFLLHLFLSFFARESIFVNGSDFETLVMTLN